MEQLAQEDAIAESLRQVKHHGGGPHHPVVSGQHPTVYQPAAALPPLLHAGGTIHSGQITPVGTSWHTAGYRV